MEIDTNALLKIAAGVPEHLKLNGWFVDSRSVFGGQFVYADDFKGMGRQHVASFPAGKKYFKGLAEFIAAFDPPTVISMLARIEELELQVCELSSQITQR